MIKVLNLFSGVGGNRKFWKNCKITAVEKDRKIAREYKKLFPKDKVIVANAYTYLEKHFSEFDFIWASPPCQSHSQMVKANYRKRKSIPDLRIYGLHIFLRENFEGFYVIENVRPYYKALMKPTFTIGRHYFWSNFVFRMECFPEKKGFIKTGVLKQKKEMQDWLGIQIDKNLYYEKNNCPLQIYRNAVHPKIGSAIFRQFKRLRKQKIMYDKLKK